MTEQDRVDKLKARMSRWQAYVDRPQANTVPETADTADTAETPVEIHQGRTVRKPERPQPALLSEQVRVPPPRRDPERANPPPADLLTDLQEARIADLKIAIAREREQADRLAEEVRLAFWVKIPKEGGQSNSTQSIRCCSPYG